MRLIHLKIGNFKNLVGFSVNFDETCKEPVTVILGRNGSGKSNLNEALVIIFRDLLEGRSTKNFGYDLRYTLRNGKVTVRVWNPPPTGEDEEHGAALPFASKEGSAIETFSFTVTENGEESRISKDKITEYLPKYVVTYYSGTSNRLQHHFFKSQLAFRNELLEGRSLPLRPLFYAIPIHSQFALLAFFMTEDKEAMDFLKEYLWIEDFESALLVLRRPHWAAGRKRSKEGDTRFWGARGVVRDFLSEVYECALAPMRLEGEIQESFDKVEGTEFLYLFLRDLKSLRELAKRSLEIARSKFDQKEVIAADFFKLLESMFMSDLIHEIRVRVSIRHAGGLTFREFSEGEQQILAVVGMLRFLRDDDSLFLLDEPDTHLNPSWGLEYLNILKKHADTGQNSHLLLATHDPLVLSNLRRNQVVILERDSATGHVTSTEPDEDPLGMGVQGILRNMFGVRSAIGTETQNKLDRHTELSALGDKRTAAQESEFRLLGDELDRAGFGREFRDPDYSAFIRAIARRPEFRKPVLTGAEIQEQEQIADEILNTILSSEKAEK